MQTVLAPNCSKSAESSNPSNNVTLNEDQYSDYDYEEDGWTPFSRFTWLVIMASCVHARTQHSGKF